MVPGKPETKRPQRGLPKRWNDAYPTVYLEQGSIEGIYMTTVILSCYGIIASHITVHRKKNQQYYCTPNIRHIK